MAMRICASNVETQILTSSSTGGNTDSSVPWDFGYDFDVGTYTFVVRTTGSDDGEAQSPIYTLLDPHLVSLLHRTLAQREPEMINAREAVA